MEAKQTKQLVKGNKEDQLTEEINDQPAVGDPPVLVVKESPPERRPEDHAGLGRETSSVRVRVPKVEDHRFFLAPGTCAGEEDTRAQNQSKRK